MRYGLILALASFGLSLTPKASAASFGCESVGGSVIFKDTFYGVLTGSLISGLYILSQKKEDRKDNGEKIATGAAVGGALGLGLGIAEIAMRECPPGRYGEVEPAGFSTSFAAVPDQEGNLGAGWRMSWRF